MKIIGGKLKGRNFYMPQDLRSTQNIIRESVFNILGNDLEGLHFLELFAGSGAVGFEAYSRGAEKVVLVERDPKNFKVMGDNIKLLGIESEAAVEGPLEIINNDVFVAIKQLTSRKRKFDVIFLDPPYSRGLARKSLKTLSAYDILHPDSVIIIQHNKREVLPEAEGRILLVKQKKYGSSLLTVYRAS